MNSDKAKKAAARPPLSAFIWVHLWLFPHPAAGGLAAEVRALEGNVFPRGGERAGELAQTLARDVRARLREANLREGRAWRQVRSRADWERFRDARLAALRTSLGPFPPRQDLKVCVTG